MIKVYTFAAGDLFHIGHIKALQQAKALGDYLIVGILTDEAIEAYKREPIIPFAERKEIFENISCVDEVVTQFDVDPTANLKIHKPDILVHGDDWDDDYPGARYMKSIGKQVVRTKYYPYRSTTMIIKAIQERPKENIKECKVK